MRSKGCAGHGLDRVILDRAAVPREPDGDLANTGWQLELQGFELKQE